MKRAILILILICLLLAGCDTRGEPPTETWQVPETDKPEPTTPVTELPTTDEPPTSPAPTTPVPTTPPVPTSINATSGSASDIQLAVNVISAIGGGTVNIPEGDFFLNGPLIIGGDITLAGAGKDVTILRTEGPATVISASGDNIRITGFSLISDNYDGGNGIVIENSKDFRVDHLHIEGYSNQAAVFVAGRDTRGVIDHCEIVMKPTSGLGYGVVVYGDDTWKDDLRLGTEYAVFIEDNTFINTRHAVAANKGAHYVFRYNLVRQGTNAHAVDAHGPYWGSKVGTQAVEIYNNVIIDPEASGSERAIGIRGGGGVIFDNVIKGYTYGIMLIIEQRQDLSSYPVYNQVHELYIWNNSCNGEQEVIVQVANHGTRFIVEDRDFFLFPKEGYEPYPYPHPLTL